MFSIATEVMKLNLYDLLKVKVYPASMTPWTLTGHRLFNQYDSQYEHRKFWG